MTATPTPPPTSLQEAVVALLETHVSEIRARRLRVRREIDPSWQRDVTKETIAALRTLLRLVFATVPDGCEIYVGSVRSTSSVACLDSGLLTVRWQVEGEGTPTPEPSLGGQIAALHPRPGDARRHLRSSLARRTREAFARLGWSFELEVLTSGHELVARASVESNGIAG